MPYAEKKPGFHPPDPYYDPDQYEEGAEMIGAGTSGLDVIRGKPDREDDDASDDEPEGGIFRVRGKWAVCLSIGPLALVIGRLD